MDFIPTLVFCLFPISSLEITILSRFMPFKYQLRSPTCLTAAAGTGFCQDSINMDLLIMWHCLSVIIQKGFIFVLGAFASPRTSINWVKLSFIAQYSSLLPRGISPSCYNWSLLPFSRYYLLRC